MIDMKIHKNTGSTVSKGYRLKPSTHNMIKKTQILVSGTQDKVIRAAMKLYMAQTKNINS